MPKKKNEGEKRQRRGRGDAEERLGEVGRGKARRGEERKGSK